MSAFPSASLWMGALALLVDWLGESLWGCSVADHVTSSGLSVISKNSRKLTSKDGARGDANVNDRVANVILARMVGKKFNIGAIIEIKLRP